MDTEEHLKHYSLPDKRRTVREDWLKKGQVLCLYPTVKLAIEREKCRRISTKDNPLLCKVNYLHFSAPHDRRVREVRLLTGAIFKGLYMCTYRGPIMPNI